MAGSFLHVSNGNDYMNLESREFPTSQVWLITGSSRGLGKALAEAVLAAVHQLVATARKPAQLADLVRRYRDQVRAVALDVASPQTSATSGHAKFCPSSKNS